MIPYWKTYMSKILLRARMDHYKAAALFCDCYGVYILNLLSLSPARSPDKLACSNHGGD